jgi:molybdopterin molybdotransferase
MITVAEAESIVAGCTRNFGDESINLAMATGRVLAENIYADRDFPPYDRVTMDGFAIKYADTSTGRRTFSVQAVQAAGDAPQKLAADACIQVMTGAALPLGADTVVPAEDTKFKGGLMTIAATATLRRAQYVHRKGSDTKQGNMLVPAGQILSGASMPLAASAGKIRVRVSKLPRVVVITTGDELVSVSRQPKNYQMRRSNNYAVKAALDQYGITVSMLHVADDMNAVRQMLDRCRKLYDVIIISGGVSKGEFDYIPGALTDLPIEILFHGVKQKPGKPMLFGASPNGPVVFACPGNPVSMMLCLHKYVMPWLRLCLSADMPPSQYAVLDQDILSPGDFQFFAQVKLYTDKTGTCYATPITNNGSGDFLSLLRADAFLELPAGPQIFRKGEAYKAVALKPIM